jgi:hypothetical protein
VKYFLFISVFLVVIMALLPMTALARGICYVGDEAILVKEAGGPSKISYIDQNLESQTLINRGGEIKEKNYGTKAFVQAIRGTRRNGQEALCVRISGQAYNGNDCELCAVLR